jgi:hypothetical protein
MVAFAIWIGSCILIVAGTRKPSKYFSSFTRRMFIAGSSLLVATLALNAYTSFVYIDYFKYLTRMSDYERSFLEEFALLSTQNLISFTTLFSSMFGASIGGNLIYKAAYPRN